MIAEPAPPPTTLAEGTDMADESTTGQPETESTAVQNDDSSASEGEVAAQLGGFV